jgi:hypothetical protein
MTRWASLTTSETPYGLRACLPSGGAAPGACSSPSPSPSPVRAAPASTGASSSARASARSGVMQGVMRGAGAGARAGAQRKGRCMDRVSLGGSGSGSRRGVLPDGPAGDPAVCCGRPDRRPPGTRCREDRKPDRRGTRTRGPVSGRPLAPAGAQARPRPP